MDAIQTDDLLRQLANGALDPRSILNLLSADAPPCPSTCKANRKESPNCLCGLVPAPGSFRKKGLWQKESLQLRDMGQDPAEQAREVWVTVRQPACMPTWSDP